MTFSATDYAADTDLERFVLDRLGTHRIRLAEPSATHDVRGEGRRRGRNHLRKSGGRNDGIEGTRRTCKLTATTRFWCRIQSARPARGARATRQRCRPGSAHVRRASLQRPPSRLPVPFDARLDLWDRLARTYASLQEARHAVTHRRAQASQAGDLEIYDDNRTAIDTVSSGEISAFAAAVHATAELVIEGSSDARRLDIVTWHLNDLHRRHGLPRLPALDPNAYRRLMVMNLIELDDGQLRFDTALAKETVDGQEPSLWDLQLHAGSRVFVGHWENAGNPENPVDFHPASPPSWLSEEVPASSS